MDSDNCFKFLSVCANELISIINRNTDCKKIIFLNFHLYIVQHFIWLNHIPKHFMKKFKNFTLIRICSKHFIESDLIVARVRNVILRRMHFQQYLSQILHLLLNILFR